MDNTIEAKFYAEFQNDGAAALCLDYIQNCIIEKEVMPPHIQSFYDAIPEHVAKRTIEFDDIAWPVNIKGQYRIAQEISDNLYKCSTENQIDRYICGILEVFEDWAKVFTPIARLKVLHTMLHEAKDEKPIYTEDEIQKEIDRVSNMHDLLLKIMRNAKDGTIEADFSHWHRGYCFFVNLFAAVCTEHNINLLEIQAKRGIWLVEKLDVLELQTYFGYDGNVTYANSLLKALPRTAATEHLILIERNGKIGTEEDLNNNHSEPQQMELKDLLPQELRTDDAVKVFQNAIDAKLITHSPEGLKWNDTKQLLAYFATKVSNEFNLTTKLDKDGNKTTSWKPFENLFKVQELKTAKQNWMRLNTKFEPTGFEKVDALFKPLHPYTPNIPV